MILDGMELSPDGHELADDYETEDQSELAHYAAWVTIENERLRGEVERLREALKGVVDAIGPPKVVHMGWACNKYSVTYSAGFDDPIKQAKAMLQDQDNET